MKDSNPLKQKLRKKWSAEHEKQELQEKVNCCSAQSRKYCGCGGEFQRSEREDGFREQSDSKN
jgi:hypothetical protein